MTPASPALRRVRQMHASARRRAKAGGPTAWAADMNARSLERMALRLKAQQAAGAKHPRAWTKRSQHRSPWRTLLYLAGAVAAGLAVTSIASAVLGRIQPAARPDGGMVAATPAAPRAEMFRVDEATSGLARASLLESTSADAAPVLARETAAGQ